MIFSQRLCAALLSLFGTFASAQTFEEVMSAAQSQVGEIGRYQQALQNPDARMQYALVQEMLKLADPALQRIAKEHALFSSNPVMREAAIKAIMDSGTTLRIQFAGDRAKAENTADWIHKRGGTFFADQGQLLFRVPPALNNDCWGRKVNSMQTKCIFRQVGNSIQFTPYLVNKTLSSVLNLGPDGVLRGNFSYENKEFVQVQIDLKE